MAITDRKLTTYAKDVSALSDTPNDDGLNAEQLKAVFMGAAKEEIKTMHNGLIDDLLLTTDGNSGADNLGVTTIPGVSGNTAQTVLEGLKTVIDNTTIGQIPDNSLTNAKLGTDVKVGSLATLTTTEKSSAVGAINEVNESLNLLNNDRGYLTSPLITNVKNISSNGMYRAIDTCLNIPSTDQFIIIASKFNTGFIQLIAKANNSGKIYTGLLRNDVGILNWQEIATTETAELTLLNGWVKAYGYTPQISRSGKNVNITGMIKSGTTTAGTIICNLPFPLIVEQSFPVFNINGVYIGNMLATAGNTLNINTTFANNTDIILSFSYTTG